MKKIGNCPFCDGSLCLIPVNIPDIKFVEDVKLMRTGEVFDASHHEVSYHEAKRIVCCGCGWQSEPAITDEDIKEEIENCQNRPIEPTLQAKIAQLEKEARQAVDRIAELEALLATSGENVLVMKGALLQIASNDNGVDGDGSTCICCDEMKEIATAAIMALKTPHIVNQCESCKRKNSCEKCTVLLYALRNIAGGYVISWDEMYVQSAMYESSGEAMHEDWTESEGPIVAVRRLCDRIRAYQYRGESF